MKHREGIREYLKDVQVYGNVIDWGCGSKPIQKYLKPNPARFITIDMSENVNPDILENIEDLDMTLPNVEADFAFCLEVIEHTWKPKNVLKNIKKCLKKGGILFLSQPYQYPTHKKDDRIRYTHHGLLQLMKEVGFSQVQVESTSGTLEEAKGFLVTAIK